MITQEKILRVVIPLIYARRKLAMSLLVLFTSFMLYQAMQVGVDAGFEKQIPLEHPYMKTFKKHEAAFGGANLVSVVLMSKDGDIYSAEFLETLRKVTDEVFFLPGIDRSRVTSLFTPGVRYIEIVEDGFSGGDVVPRDYQPTDEMLKSIRSNVGKAGVIGRLVSNGQDGAMVVAELLELHPVTGERLDYQDVAKKLEAIRQQFETENISIHIIGFAKIIGDVTDASMEVVSFFAVALLLSMLLLWAFCGSLRLSFLPMIAALMAVVWEFGMLHTAGLGLDPFAILVPFLVLSIGVSHGVQYINAWGNEVAENGMNSYDASVETFRRLAIPGTTALITDIVGFATIGLIAIDIVQEMAINAALGMVAIIIANKVMLPIVLTWVKLANIEKFRSRQKTRKDLGDKLWKILTDFTSARWATVTLMLCALLLAGSIWKYEDLKIGDLQVGVPELRPDSRYNIDSGVIADNFFLGVDLLKVIVETDPEACIRYDVMDSIDRYAWHMQNTKGVQLVISLPQVARRIRGEWNEGSLKWRSLPRNQFEMVQSMNPVPSSSGLKNPDCSVMPVLIFTTDHRADTISRIVKATKDYNNSLDKNIPVNFALASGNVGVMAATNEEIKAKEVEVVLWVYAVLLLFIWLSFRSIPSIICIVAPLALVSMMTYAFMAFMDIGLKSATLPVVAFGVGIGVDDGIYLWSVLQKYLDSGKSLRAAWYTTLQHTGKAVIFTSVALLVSVSTWLLSGLQFQADMGLLLVFMFTANLFGAILVLPAIAHFMVTQGKK